MSEHPPKAHTMDKAVNRPRLNKRKRVSRACDYCRARKHRCDGRRPACSSCSATRQQCSYGLGIKKRGLPTGYVRALELLWALVFTVIPNSTDIVGELMQEAYFALDPRSRLVMHSRLIKDPEMLRQAWEDSGIQGQLDQLLFNVQESSDTGANTVPTENDQGSTLSPPPHLRPFDPIQSTSADEARPDKDPVGANSAETPSRQRTIATQAPPQRDATSTTFPQNVQRLLDIYFAHTHCWLPIVQKHKMLELLYSPSQTALAEGGNLATFWAVLALSSLQESPDPLGTAGNRDFPSTPEQIYAKARQQIPNEGARAPGYVQALLILSLFKLDQGELSASWHLIGQAVRVCLDLGTMPLDRNSPKVACGGDDNQNRLLQSCFVLDTIVSCQLSKPPHLRTADVQLLPISAETGPDEWEPRTVCPGKSNESGAMHQPLRAISIFNRYVDVIRILNDAMSDPAASDELCVKNSLALSRWHDQLPKHCALSSLPGQEQLEAAGRISPQLVNLHLAFKSTELFLKAQRALTSQHGLPGTRGTEVIGLSTMHLILMFAKHFGMPTMPAIFTSYQAIGDRAVARSGPAVSTPSSHFGRLDLAGNHQSPVLSCEFPPGSLPTPAEYPEYVMTGTNDLIPSTVPSLSCNTEGKSTII
ncbi:Zn(2)-C6 fungal-type domain-containing protein [Fusarium keratoplasticum]|nr:Zn(2)-C6 fungal-type domain-containing protein [Fusarium keratoplasticum]